MLATNVTEGGEFCYEGLLNNSYAPSPVAQCFMQCSAIVEATKVVFDLRFLQRSMD
jgi:hypothetical protein